MKTVKIKSPFIIFILIFGYINAVAMHYADENIFKVFNFLDFIAGVFFAAVLLVITEMIFFMALERYDESVDLQTLYLLLYATWVDIAFMLIFISDRLFI